MIRRPTIQYSGLHYHQMRFVSRSTGLSKFLKRFTIYKIKHSPSFLDKCGSNSVPSLKAKEAYRIIMREANDAKKPEYTLELFKEIENSNISDYPGIVIQLLKALKLKKDAIIINDILNLKKIKKVEKENILIQNEILGLLNYTKGLATQKDYFNSILKDGKPTVYLYNEMIKFTELNEGKELLRIMRKSNQILPNVFSYNFLMKNYADDKKIESAFNVFLQMEKDKILPSTKTFEILFSTLSEFPDLKKILYLRKRMDRKYKILPNGLITENLIHSLSKLKQIKLVEEIIENSLHLQKTFPKDSRVTLIKPPCYLYLLDGYLLLNNIQGCDDIIQKLLHSDEKYLYLAYLKLIQFCCSKNEISLSWSYYNHAKQNLFMIHNSEIFELIIHLYFANINDQTTQYLCSIIVDIISMDIQLSDLLFLRLANFFIEISAWEHVSVILRHMVLSGIPVTNRLHQKFLVKAAEVVDPTTVGNIKTYFKMLEQQPR